MTNSTVNCTSIDADKALTDNPTGRRGLYGIVGILSICCNSALCAIVFRNKKMLKKSYNMLVLVLAFVDTVTGTLIGKTLRKVLKRKQYYKCLELK